uniref:Uncharacterized protein n=1 Tax=uncultured Desulfobacterium sp. TaxID=201089 RepID=E1YMI7_9BACT|nr:unknown protein [uncultured Desulfobacterium sp.]
MYCAISNNYQVFNPFVFLLIRTYNPGSLIYNYLSFFYKRTTAFNTGSPHLELIKTTYG